MKRLNLIAAFALLMAVGCTKKDQPVNDNADAQIQKLMNAQDFHTEIQIYAMMDPAVKYKVWMNHLKNAKDQFLRAGESQKIGLLDQLIGQMKISAFEKDSKDQTVFLNYFIPQWSEEARKVFSSLGFYDLVSNPKINEIRKSVDAPVATGKQTAPTATARETFVSPDCFCHVGQLGYSCSTTKLKFDLSLGGGVSFEITEGRCLKNSLDCDYSSWGCGNFWAYSCGGNSCQF